VIAMTKSTGTRTLAAGLTLAVFLAGSGACDSNPAGPSILPPPTTSPAPGLVLAPFHVSGVVTDEDDRPLSNALVVINRYTLIKDGKAVTPVTWSETRTDAQGRYQMDIEAVRDAFHKPWLSNIVGFGFARVDTREYPDDFQFLTSATSTVVRNFRLNRFVQLAADDSATVTFRPDDSVCRDDFQATLCRTLRITVPADGTLTVNVAPLHGAATAYVSVLADTDVACPCASATVSYPMKAGEVSLVAISIPPGFLQTRSYAVTTVFRSNTK
jgi:hypothetical protein